MKNSEHWQPSKYVFRNGRLSASRDSAEIDVSSRLIADLIGALYGSRLAVHAKGRLLDLGCGKVPLFAAYRSHITDNICVDWANSLHRNEYLDLEWDLTQQLPFDDAQFDTIVLSDVLEHVPAPERLWAEIARLLRTDGKLIMNVPFYYWLHEKPHDYYRYTEFALRRFAATAKLELLELTAIGGAPEIMADIFAKNIVRLPLLGRWFAAAAQSATGWLVQRGPGRRISEATRANFPFGYFLVARKPA